MKRMVTEEQLNNIEGETPESLSVDGNNIILEKKNGEKLTAEIASGGQLYRHDVYFSCGTLGGSSVFSSVIGGYVFYSTSAKSATGDFITNHCPKVYSFTSSVYSSKYFTIMIDRTSGSTLTNVFESTIGEDGSVTTTKSNYFFLGTILGDVVTPL